MFSTGKLLNNFASIPQFLYISEKEYRYAFVEEHYLLLNDFNKYVFKNYKSQPKKSDKLKAFADGTDANNDNEDNKYNNNKTWDKGYHARYHWCLPKNSLECKSPCSILYFLLYGFSFTWIAGGVFHGFFHFMLNDSSST